jgi:hypothetical protein
MMKHRLLAGLLAFAAVAGIAGANGPCESGGNLALPYYSVCVLNGYVYDAPPNYHYESNTVASAFAYGPNYLAYAGVELDQYAYHYDYPGCCSGDGSGTFAGAVVGAGPAFLSGGASQDTYTDSGAGDGKSTSVFLSTPGGYVYVTQYDYGAGCSIDVDSDVVPGTSQPCGPVPEVPDIPTLPQSPL